LKISKEEKCVEGGRLICLFVTQEYIYLMDPFDPVVMFIKVSLFTQH